MKVNKRTIYSSMEVTEEERNFCKTLFEVAENVANELCLDTAENLYDIIRDIKEDGYVNFDNYR